MNEVKMEKNNEINLQELVSAAAQELVDNRWKQAANTTKQQLQRIEQLSVELKRAERDIKSKREKIEKAQAKIDRIRNGDWKVLEEMMKNQSND